MSESRPRNPTRRNRNIGTARSGHGQNNRLVIPERATSIRLFYESLTNPVRVTRSLGRQTIAFLVEKPHRGFGHACTVDDIVRVLELLDRYGAAPVSLIVLRQPTRKQRILVPVWGRLQYFSPLDANRDPAIFVEAQPLAGTFIQDLPRTPDDTAELERLKEDGHSLIREKKRYCTEWNPYATRATQLYRTVPHEVGHWMDYVTWPERCPVREEVTESTIRDLYYSRPDRERELFAHRFAEGFLERSKSLGQIPFEPLGDPRQIREEGMSPDWFSALRTR
jgi:hypothetical protein